VRHVAYTGDLNTAGHVENTVVVESQLFGIVDKWQHFGLNKHSFSTFGPVNTGMDNNLQISKPFQYVTSCTGHIYLAIPLCNEYQRNWGVNGHTMPCSSPVFVISQQKLVSG